MVDARDLKSRGSDPVPVRPRSPAPSQYRGVEQLVARRAHNPEVVGSSPASATRKNTRNRKISGVFLHFSGGFVFSDPFPATVLTPILPLRHVKNQELILFYLHNDGVDM